MHRDECCTQKSNQTQTLPSIKGISYFFFFTNWRCHPKKAEVGLNQHIELQVQEQSPFPSFHLVFPSQYIFSSQALAFLYISCVPNSACTSHAEITLLRTDLQQPTITKSSTVLLLPLHSPRLQQADILTREQTAFTMNLNTKLQLGRLQLTTHTQKSMTRLMRQKECHQMSSDIVTRRWAWSFPKEACQGGKRVQSLQLGGK